MHPGAAMAQQNAQQAGGQGGDWKNNLNLPNKDTRLKTTVRAPAPSCRLPPLLPCRASPAIW